ncbi:MAG: DUF4397 domain-containing protein [Peptostreptococcaceae bacterium]
MNCLEMKDGNSLVRVFHAVPNGPDIDIYMDDTIIFSNLKYSNFTEYVYSINSNHQVDIYISGTKENPIASATVNFSESELITLAVIGNLKDVSLLVITDYVSKEPSSEYSTARIIHLSESTPGVDVYIDGDILFTDIEYKQGTRYLDFNIGKYHIKIVEHDSERVILPLKINLKANRIYTIYIVGEKDNVGVIQSVDGNTYVCE